MRIGRSLVRLLTFLDGSAAQRQRRAGPDPVSGSGEQPRCYQRGWAVSPGVRRLPL